MVLLFTMTHRQTAAIYSRALPGGETIGWAVGEGSVSGLRIRGRLRRANRPWHRADGVQIPNSYGVISTDDGASVFFDFRGLGRPLGDRPPEAYGGMTFRTADERYAWLNSIFAVAERRDDGGPEAAVIYNVYECTPGG
jgi:hypothetical protein